MPASFFEYAFFFSFSCQLSRLATWIRKIAYKLLIKCPVLRPYLKCPVGDFESLSKILKGSSDPNSSRQLTEAARQVLTQVKDAIQKQQVHYIIISLGQHVYYLQNLLLQQVCGQIVSFYGSTFPFHQLRY